MLGPVLRAGIKKTGRSQEFMLPPFFYYKNLVYKNIKASNGPKIKNILRTFEGFIFEKKKLLMLVLKKYR